MITLTLTFTTLAEAQHTIALLAAGIAYLDRPDVGVSFAVAPPVPVKVDGSTVVTNPFIQGVAAAPAVPTGTLVAPIVAETAPMPPIAASVPAAAPLTGTPTPASVPPNASGVELDAQGLPWDGRIHGATKAKNDDGKWRQKRGLNDLALKARVEAELRAGQAARVPAGLSVAPPATIPVFVPAAPAAVTPPPPFVATVPAAPVTAPETFGLLMARLAPRMQTDPAAAAVINTVLGQFALTSLAQLGARPDLVAPVAMCVDQALGVAA